VVRARVYSWSSTWRLHLRPPRVLRARHEANQFETRRPEDDMRGRDLLTKSRIGSTVMMRSTSEEWELRGSIVVIREIAVQCVVLFIDFDGRVCCSAGGGGLTVHSRSC
jgi:hypothetical protein